MSLRVVQIAGTAAGGEWFARQVTALAGRGHTVMAILPEEGTLSESLRAASVRVAIVRFKGGRPKDLPRLVRAQIELSVLIRRFRPDVVHYHLFKAIVMGRLAAFAAGTPARVSQWPGYVHLDVPVLRALDRITMPIDHVVVGSCTDIAQRYARLGARSTAIVHYGLDTSAIDPDAPEYAHARQTLAEELGVATTMPLVGMVAHMYPTNIGHFQEVGIKGHEIFIDSAGLLAADRHDAMFLVVGDEFAGDGRYRRRLEERARSRGLGRRMVFLGHRTDALRIMAGLDVLVVPSLRESASYVAMEGLLLRRGVVASRAGGLPDTVQHGETGLLVNPGDAAALASAIQSLLDDHAARLRFGSLGRERVIDRFDIERTVDRLEETYERLPRRKDASR